MISHRGNINRSSGADRGRLPTLWGPGATKSPARPPIRLRGHQLTKSHTRSVPLSLILSTNAPCAPHEHPVLCSREGGVGPQGIPHHTGCASCIPKLCMMHRSGSYIPKMDPPGPRTLYILCPSPKTYKKPDFTPQKPRFGTKPPQNLARSP